MNISVLNESKELVFSMNTDTNKYVVKDGYEVIKGDNPPFHQRVTPPDTLTMKVKLFDEELYPEGVVPIGGSKSDWIDLRARETIHLERGESYCIPLGIAVQLPKGYEALILPRSSTFRNTDCIQTNSMGIIDESYCGDNDEWKLPVLCLSPVGTEIKRGDRICQFRIQKHQPTLEIEYVDTLGNSDRGGLGSTGRN